MKEWLALLAAAAALVISVATSISGDRLGVERRVSTLEGQAVANQKALEEIKGDVRDIRQFLMGNRKQD